MRQRMYSRGLAILVLPAVVAAAGCMGKSAGPPMPPPPAASVAHPLAKEVVEWDTYSGHFQSRDMANVVARSADSLWKCPLKKGRS